MTAIIRRFIIIGILFAVFLFVQTIQIETTSLVNPKTLAVLGFLVLASFALGEVFAMLKLPRVIGYLLIGIFFGPFSDYIFQTNLLKVFSFKVIDDLSLVNNVTLGLIALIAGMELKIANIKNSAKSISLILLFKIMLIFVLVTAAVFASAQLIPFLAGAGWRTILSAGLILSVVALGTSIELTLVVADESKAEGRFIDLILSTAIVKDLIVILLLAVVLTISTALTSPSGVLDIQVFGDLGKELLLSILIGAVLGGLTIFYLRYVGKEMLLFILAFVVFGSELSSTLHLETLVVFVAAGFVIQNYSKNEEIFHKPLKKLSLPIFITFFTLAGASINLISVTEAFAIGLIIVVVRGIALFFSVRLAAKISKEPKELVDFGWLGFLSIGGLILGLSIIIAQKLPGLGADLKNLIMSIVAFNIFIGPILLKIGIGKAKKITALHEGTSQINLESIAGVSEAGETVPKKLKKRFNTPNLNDERLNKSLFNILFKVNDILTQFDRKFIQSRSEESIELVVNLTEKYSDEYQNLKKVITQPGLSPSQIRNEILKVQKNIADWLIALSEERKETENHILRLEPLVQDLFYSFIDLTDGLQNEYLVELEREKYTIKKDDPFGEKFRKFLYKTKLFFNRSFNKDYKLRRIVDYKNLAKYYLVGESSQEILEAVNLVGTERLTTLRILKSFYSETSKDLDELIKLLIQERDNPGLPSILLSKLDEIHQQTINAITVYTSQINTTTEEISNRLYYAIANPFNHLVEILGIAGTHEFKKKNFRFSKVYEKSETAKETALQSIRYWALYYSGILGLFQKEAYVNRLKVRINEIVNSSLLGVSEEINSNLRDTNNDLTKRIDQFSKKIKEYEKKKPEQLKSLLATTKEKDFAPTIDKHIKILETTKAGKRISLLFENLIKGFTNITNELPKKIELLEEADLQFKERTPKQIQLKSVPIRPAAENLIERKLPREIGEVNELLINQLNLIAIEVKNFVLIVNFHFDTAIKELENEDIGFNTALNLAVSFCEKMNDRIAQINQLIDRLEENIILRITEKVDVAINELNEMILQRSSFNINLYLGKEKQKSRIISLAGGAGKTAGHELRKYSLVIKRSYKKYFQDIVHDLLIKYHLRKVKAEEVSSENVLQTQSSFNRLPYIYKKLFDGTPLETSDFYVGQDYVHDTIQSALANFNESRKSSVILIGEPGGGKRSLINSIINNEFNNLRYIRFNIEETIVDKQRLLKIFSRLLKYERTLSLDELVVLLNDKTNKKIIVLENINKLFLRKINGYGALETFKYILNVTSQNTLWMCSTGKYSWEFLDNNFDFGDVFERKIFINELHKKDIKSIIIQRHNATGYGLQFVPDQLQEFKSKFIQPRSKDEEQAVLSEQFFNRLEEYSGGNIVSAMFYWLLSIESVKENRVVIRPPKKIVSKALANLDHVYCLTLSSLLLHGSLTDNQHSEMFKLSIESSREILNTLVSLNLIRKDQIEINDNIYFINKFLYKIIETELIKRNIK